MHPLTAKQIAEILLANGFILTRQRGSHRIYRNEATGALVPVAFHGGNKPMKRGTFLSIVRQSKLAKETFEK